MRGPGMRLQAFSSMCRALQQCMHGSRIMCPVLPLRTGIFSFREAFLVNEEVQIQSPILFRHSCGLLGTCQTLRLLSGHHNRHSVALNSRAFHTLVLRVSLHVPLVLFCSWCS